MNQVPQLCRSVYCRQKSNFMAPYENRADLAWFLSEIIVTKSTVLPEQCELVTVSK